MHPLPIQHYCPELTHEFMVDNCPVVPGFLGVMEIGGVITQKPQAEFTAGFSLFNRDVSDSTGTQECDSKKWKEKYYNGLRNNLEAIAKSSDDFAVNLFLDPELSELAPDLVKAYRFLNVYIMKRPSNAATGMFWRFLIWDDKYSNGSRMAFCLDLDEDFEASMGKLKKLSPVSVVFTDPGNDLVFNRERVAKSYTPLCGGLTAASPRDVAFDVVETVARFLYYQTTLQHLVEPPNEYNRPVANMPMGFGNTWNLYGSDEQFLAKVLYYHLRRKGKLDMLCLYSMLKAPTPAFEADYLFTKENGNQIHAT